MPFTQSFDQVFTVFLLLAASIYLARTVLGISLILIGAIPSTLGASARAAGQRITPRLILKIITTFTGLLVAATGVGATTALAAPNSSASSSYESGDVDYDLLEDFDDLEDLIAIDRGPIDPVGLTNSSTSDHATPESEGESKSISKSKPKATKAPTASPTPFAQSSQSPGSPNPSNPQVPTKMRTSPTVVVKQGDTLWSIAASQLGTKATDTEIDREWKRWYRANTKVVGSNPDLIIPGMKLEAPQS